MVRPRLATRSGRSPLVIGICGAQGSGKSTVTEALESRFRAEGYRVASLSLDDLYLGRATRKKVAAATHPLFATRGVPGTHDVALGIATLDSLSQPKQTLLPRFDKAQDEPFPVEQWEAIDGPVDLILFEGWCVGAMPQSDAELAEPINALERERDQDRGWRDHVNALLDGVYRDLFGRLDLLMMLAAPSFDIVTSWRIEQENSLRKKLTAEGRALPATMMDAGQIAEFVQYFERLTRQILKEMPDRADLVIRLASDRRITSFSRKKRGLVIS